MKLSFYPAPGTLVPDRTQPSVTGQRRHYVGRSPKPPHPATGAAFTIESATPFGMRLKKIARNDLLAGCPCLYAADAETAAECDIPLLSLELKDGEMVEASKSPVKAKK